jgi:hypothetical protein
MDQQELQRIENKCIQEQPAWCMAACPLHVDARTFIRHVSKEKWDEAWSDYLTYCAMCRDSLSGVGKRVIHLLDLFFPLGDRDPAAASRIGWSERRENRARLKARLLKTIWGEGFERMEQHQSIRLKMDPEVRELLDRRRILDEDVQKVIHHALETGDRLFHPETGRYKASFNPYKTTFWIEYTPHNVGVSYGGSGPTASLAGKKPRRYIL